MWLLSRLGCYGYIFVFWFSFSPTYSPLFQTLDERVPVPWDEQGLKSKEAAAQGRLREG